MNKYSQYIEHCRQLVRKCLTCVPVVGCKYKQKTSITHCHRGLKYSQEFTVTLTKRTNRLNINALEQKTENYSQKFTLLHIVKNVTYGKLMIPPSKPFAVAVMSGKSLEHSLFFLVDTVDHFMSRSVAMSLVRNCERVR